MMQSEVNHWEVLITLYFQIVSAVEYCHQKKIIHRDLKVFTQSNLVLEQLADVCSSFPLLAKPPYDPELSKSYPLLSLFIL